MSSDTTLITCIANDFGFENIYSRQLEGLGKEGDVLIAISTSGRSKNIINSLLEAKKKKIVKKKSIVDQNITIKGVSRVYKELL